MNTEEKKFIKHLQERLKTQAVHRFVMIDGVRYELILAAEENERLREIATKHEMSVSALLKTK